MPPGLSTNQRAVLDFFQVAVVTQVGFPREASGSVDRSEELRAAAHI
jgi:hypothetical protein